MTTDFLKQAGWFLLLCLAQGLVFNHVQLFSCAVPLLYIHFVLAFPIGYPKWGSLLWGFAMGIVIDMFANTPGVAMCSLTLLACIQPYLVQLFVSRDTEGNKATSMREMSWNKYLTYSSLMVFIYCVIFFSLEMFAFFNWSQWLMNVIGSTLLTCALILTFESIRK